MRVFDLVFLIITLTALYLQLLILGEWKSSQSTGYSLLVVAITAMMAGVVVYPLKYYLENKEISTLLETAWFEKFVGLFILCVLGLALLNFSGAIKTFFYIEVIFVGLYAYARRAIRP